MKHCDFSESGSLFVKIWEWEKKCLGPALGNSVWTLLQELLFLNCDLFASSFWVLMFTLPDGYIQSGVMCLPCCGESNGRVFVTGAFRAHRRGGTFRLRELIFKRPLNSKWFLSVSRNREVELQTAGKVQRLLAIAIKAHKLSHDFHFDVNFLTSYCQIWWQISELSFLKKKKKEKNALDFNAMEPCCLRHLCLLAVEIQFMKQLLYRPHAREALCRYVSYLWSM